jgi:hypothetical protein
MLRFFPFLCVMTTFLVGCPLPGEPELPLVPIQLPPVMETTLPSSPVERIELALLPSRVEYCELPPVIKPKGSPKKPAAASSPVDLVRQAQRAARVEPSERGYFGGSAEHVYSWTPGKVYTIYLSPKQPTGIFLPPGERLVTGLYLSEDEYEVKNERAGSDLRAYDAMTIRPLGDRGEVDTFLLTESGRRYLLHLVVGQVGMVAVTFEGPPLHQASAPTPTLVLPRPPQ